MTVTLSLWDKAPYVFVNGDLPEQVVDALEEELSFEVPDHQYTDAWKEGRWDGYERLLYTTNDGSRYFAQGCLPLVRSVLDTYGVSYDLEGFVRPGRGDLDLGWQTDMELRDYQQDAVDECLRRGSGIVVLPTGAGKTLIGLYLMQELQQPTLVTVHLTEVAEQWCERIEAILGVEPARYFGGDRETGDVQVALYQSIYDDDTGEVRDDVRLDHTVFLADEVHRVGADTFNACAMQVTAPYRYGFSATPEREDNATLKVIAGTGPMIADLSAERLIGEGYLAEPDWQIYEAPATEGTFRNWQAEYKAAIVENEARNELLCEAIAKELPRPTLVTVEQINHGERLEARLKEGQFPHDEEQYAVNPDGVAFVYGDAPDRAEHIQAFRDGDLPVLIATRGIVGEGFDVPEIASFVVAGGLKSSTSMIQQVGRALRPAGGDTATIVDVIDNGEWVGRHSEERIRTYQDYYGSYGP